MRGKPTDRARARSYLALARQFAESARDDHGKQRWDAAVSAAAHAVISATDAVCVWYLKRRSRGPSHEEALNLVRDVGEVDAEERSRLVRNVQDLLDLKHKAEYEGRPCRKRDGDRALKALERALETVETWAESWE